MAPALVSSMIFGPVSSATPGGGSWIAISIPPVILALAWRRYFKRDTDQSISIYNLIGLSAICVTMMLLGIRGLMLDH